MPEVRQERTGWRDEALSRRHRRWGWDCPAVDLDLPLPGIRPRKASCDRGVQKRAQAAPQYASHPTYQAMIDLGDRAQIPVIACRYSDDFQTWKVTPLNKPAKQFLPQRAVLSEQEWVKLLYAIRGYAVPAGLSWTVWTWRYSGGYLSM